MQLRLQPKNNKFTLMKRLTIKIVLFASIFALSIFLIDKIKMPVPNKLIKQEISNDKLITLK